MRPQEQRDQKTLDIMAALALFAGLVLGGALLLYLVDRSIGLRNSLFAPVMVALVLIGVAIVIARLATRRR